jgi:hypothetical protein
MPGLSADPERIFALSDIFREVEEEVRRERFEKLWKQYGDYVIAAIAVLVLAAAGYQLWRYYDARERTQAAASYIAAQQLSESGQSDKAAEAFARLAQSAPSGYAKLARLQEADSMLAAGKRDDAIKLYRKIAAEDESLFGDVARIRAGWALVDIAPKSEVEALLAPLTDPASPWRASAQEILAYADYRAGDTKAALTTFKSLSKNADAPAGVAQRSGAMAEFIQAGGDANYGTVPEPEKPADAAPPGAAPSTPPAGGTQGKKPQ